MKKLFCILSLILLLPAFAHAHGGAISLNFLITLYWVIVAGILLILTPIVQMASNLLKKTAVYSLNDFSNFGIMFIILLLSVLASATTSATCERFDNEYGLYFNALILLLTSGLFIFFAISRGTKIFYIFFPVVFIALAAAGVFT